jgi:DNA-binding response OmpR family regulator
MPPQNSNSTKTILFADGDSALRKFVSAVLTTEEYNLIVADDGKSALEKALAFDGVIDLLLSDIEMPDMTGIELAIQLNRVRPETRILLISGLESGILVLNNGWQFLPKPFMREMLRDRIRDFLSEQLPADTDCAWLPENLLAPGTLPSSANGANRANSALHLRHHSS